MNFLKYHRDLGAKGNRLRKTFAFWCGWFVIKITDQETLAWLWP
ncbi:hypothetical protein VAS14_07254 [Vibrio angustum S14]|uniref:Uncharacterized protein n=1 Tax=Photobacterium angustum (strain S14 / CCUG 15956) TaxID=314292 RepID=Q1ZJX4_PHOAS|nr:hypothetical protein VAS14_07254 [Vibrio angustum S14] [Photobacterium angustum S14]